MNVALIGASNKPDRYAYMAFVLLREHGHRVFPVHPFLDKIDGVTVFPSIIDIPEAIDTVTLYVGAQHSNPLVQDIISKAPRRIIFNPGTENQLLEHEAVRKGIAVIQGCTLVMLKTGKF